MTTLRLESGVCISSNNPSILQQYLKYGAVEVKDEAVEVKEKTPVTDEKKPVTKRTKN